MISFLFGSVQKTALIYNENMDRLRTEVFLNTIINKMTKSERQRANKNNTWIAFNLYTKFLVQVLLRNFTVKCHGRLIKIVLRPKGISATVNHEFGFNILHKTVVLYNIFWSLFYIIEKNDKNVIFLTINKVYLI